MQLECTLERPRRSEAVVSSTTFEGLLLSGCDSEAEERPEVTRDATTGRPPQVPVKGSGFFLISWVNKTGPPSAEMECVDLIHTQTGVRAPV